MSIGLAQVEIFRHSVIQMQPESQYLLQAQTVAAITSRDSGCAGMMALCEFARAKH